LHHYVLTVKLSNAFCLVESSSANTAASTSSHSFHLLPCFCWHQQRTERWATC